jgi:hypothetical protein
MPRRVHDKTGGTGHLYQGRFNSFPIQNDNHLLTVMRFVERTSVIGLTCAGHQILTLTAHSTVMATKLGGGSKSQAKTS